MTEVNFYLRRTNGSTNELLFLPAETIDLDYSNDLVSERIPGNTATGLTGETSLNFIFNLGRQGFVVRASGVLVDVSSAQYATLPGDVATERYVITNGSNVAAVSATAVDQSGQDIRWALLSFVADMSLSTYSDFKLFWPAFYDNSAGKLWEGSIRSLRLSEVAGEPGQYTWALDWQVGLST